MFCLPYVKNLILCSQKVDRMMTFKSKTLKLSTVVLIVAEIVCI